MVPNQTPDKEQVRAETEPEKMANLNQEGVMVGFTTEPGRFKPKPGRIFPKKRRLVKSMILDSILQIFYSIFASGDQKGKEASLPKTSAYKKNNKIFSYQEKAW